MSALRVSSKTGPQGLKEWLQCVTFDTINDLAFGEFFDSLPQREANTRQNFILDNIAVLVFMSIAVRINPAKLIKLLTPSSLLKAIEGFYQSTSHQMDP